MDYTKRAQALRDVKERHYNCCQAALLPFAEEQGLDPVDHLYAEDFMDDGTPIRLKITIDRNNVRPSPPPFSPIFD